MHGYLVDSRHILANEQTLPNNASILSTNAVWVGNNDNKLELRVYAKNAFNIPTNANLCIELVTSDDDTVYLSPVDQTHMCLLNKTINDNAVDVNEGDLLFAGGIPRNFVTGYIKLKYTTDVDLSLAKIDAFVRVLS